MLGHPPGQHGCLAWACSGPHDAGAASIHRDSYRRDSPAREESAPPKIGVSEAPGTAVVITRTVSLVPRGLVTSTESKRRAPATQISIMPILQGHFRSARPKSGAPVPNGKHRYSACIVPVTWNRANSDIRPRSRQSSPLHLHPHRSLTRPRSGLGPRFIPLPQSLPAALSTRPASPVVGVTASCSFSARLAMSSSPTL